MRIVADHLRASVFMIVDGVRPTNKDRGYVLRRLIRRAIIYAQDLDIREYSLPATVPVVISLYARDFPEVSENFETIVRVLEKEERGFRQTLRRGLRELHRRGPTGVTGEDIFTLYDTFGFPSELAVEEVLKHDYELSSDWREEFERSMQKQRARSRSTL